MAQGDSIREVKCRLMLHRNISLSAPNSNFFLFVDLIATAEQVDRHAVAPEEASEIQNLGVQNSKLRMDIDQAGRELLDAQELEVGYRAASQRLLHEQTIAQNLLNKVSEESKQERNQSRLLIEDLELQIFDLKANQKMMQQFSQNEDLKNSQILGAERQITDSTRPTTGTSSRKKKSKKISKPPRNSM